MSEDPDRCRIDVWLWRARFFKTRALAARVVEAGGVRLARGVTRATLDKPSRSVRVGDSLAFAQGSRWIALRVESLGERRGPASEARSLFSLVDLTGASDPVDPSIGPRVWQGRDADDDRGAGQPRPAEPE